MAIRYVLLDFDGTCTQIDVIEARFLARYRELLEAQNPEVGSLLEMWTPVLDEVRAASPQAGWTISETSSAAPAAADPYILAFEAAQRLKQRGKIANTPKSVYEVAYGDHAAPWRAEIGEVLQALKGMGVQVAFVSNSDTGIIQCRLERELVEHGIIPTSPTVQGHSSKYTVCELAQHAPDSAIAHRDLFSVLPAAEPCALLRRPIYLRRAPYFAAITEVLRQLGGSRLIHWDEVLVVGDIYELDLALPKALGAHVHLIERVKPYETYDFELALMRPEDVSRDLLGVLAHVARVRTG